MKKHHRRSKRHGRNNTDRLRATLPFTIHMASDLEAFLVAFDPSTTVERWSSMLGGVALDSAKTWVEDSIHTITLTEKDGTLLFSYDCTFRGRPGTFMTLDLSLNSTGEKEHGWPLHPVGPVGPIRYQEP